MKVLKFDLSNIYGKFKILNAVNGGPWYKRHAADQWMTNFAEYKAARIPYSRNHDSNINMEYGGPFVHDISAIFPNFDADENDPVSYDFACTDESVLCTLETGTKTFFRLGQSIEHQIKKHDTLPPKDFHKWARICERVIRHYTEGWANGFTLDMPYWEIWNEPNLDEDDSPNKRCWGGTKAQFFDLFEITAKHLKARFPHLKIGGPALAEPGTPEGYYDDVWTEEFLSEMQKRGVPMDFFSWHTYCGDPARIMARAEKMRAFADKYGYKNAESILSEWNYIRDWTANFAYSIGVIRGMKGAAFVASVISEAQKSSVDMLMYYDTRPSIFCGAFDIYTCRPLKAYYPLKWYGEFYDLVGEIRCTESYPDIYSLCGVNKDGKITAIITRYSDRDGKEKEEIKVDFGKDAAYDIYLLDENHDGELVKTTKDLSFVMPVNTVIKITEK